MTERLYYHDSFLYDFDARVIEALDSNGKPAIVLDRTAFYPTSGGQVHDLGTLTADGQQGWQQFTARLTQERNAEDFLPHLQGVWAKLGCYCARIALALHCMRQTCKEIPPKG